MHITTEHTVSIMNNNNINWMIATADEQSLHELHATCHINVSAHSLYGKLYH